MKLSHLILIPLASALTACASSQTGHSEHSDTSSLANISVPVIKSVHKPNAPIVPSLEELQAQKMDKMIDYARQFMGTKYVWGGASPKSGFDCSGYIKYVYNQFDISIPRTTASYPSLYERKVTLKEAKPGDLIVFTGTNPKIRKPGHAGIVTANANGKLTFIHSSSSKKHFGVTETNYYQSGYPRRFLAVIRMNG